MLILQFPRQCYVQCVILHLYCQVENYNIIRRIALLLSAYNIQKNIMIII